MERLQALQDWAARQLGVDALDIAPASADASFRRYFRVTAKGRDYIVMDAPPASANNLATAINGRQSSC
ncbi:MAG TPA: phosphotransferase, partial [Thiobacillus sp.]|nr:phosphotransferase [Thiobacillus sp.]